MGVHPGEGGQEFINDVISVDGGINNTTMQYVKDYADIVVSGSYITNSDDYDEMINALKIYELSIFF